MSETPEERRERLVEVIGDYYYPHDILDALLSALESPVAEMVRRGVERVDIGAGHPYNEVGSWYRPRAD